MAAQAHRASDPGSLMNGVTSWQRYVYGKLVESPDGPIVRGWEHGCTGRSPAFPAELEHLCHPNKVGLGSRDSTAWRHSPWAPDGAIVQRPAQVGGQPWIFAGRVRERPEQGEGASGRLYGEAHYVALPARLYRPTSLLELSRHLFAVPRLEVSNQLRPVELARAQPLKLPDDWLTRVGPKLRAVMSGVAWSEQDWEISIDEFLVQVSWCLAALPATLTWRLPIDAGVLQMRGDAALACGVAALGGLRVLRGSTRNASDFDFRTGNAYLEWLHANAAGSRSTAELSAAIAEAAPELSSLEIVAIDVPWSRAVSSVDERLHDFGTARAALVELQAGRLQSLPMMKWGRRPFILAVCQRAVDQWRGHEVSAFGRTLELAALAERAWPDAWAGLPAHDNGDDVAQVMQLVDRGELSSPALLASVATFELPDGIEANLLERLRPALVEAKPGAWLDLVVDAPPQSWLVRRFDALWIPWTWAALRLAPPGGPGQLAHALRALPEHDGVAALLRALREVESDDLERLIAFASNCAPVDAHVLVRLFDAIAVHSPWLAMVLADNARVEHGRPHDVATTTGLVFAAELAAESCRHPRELSPSMTRLLLDAWPSLELQFDNTSLVRHLAKSVGAPYSVAILGVRTSTLGRDADIADAWCRARLRSDPNLLEQLLEGLTSMPEIAVDRARALARLGLQIAPPVEARTHPMIACLRALAGGQTEALTRGAVVLEPELLDMLDFDVPALMKHATDVATLSFLARAFPKTKPPQLDANQLADLLVHVFDRGAHSTTLVTLVTEQGWSEARGWRLLVPAHVLAADPGPYGVEEWGALNQLHANYLLGLAASGHVLPPETLQWVDAAMLEQLLQSSPEIPPALLESATSSVPNDGVRRELGVAILRRLRGAGVPREDVRARLNPTLMRRFTQLLSSPSQAHEADFAALARLVSGWNKTESDDLIACVFDAG
ncbi:hypothetical protein G6O69_18420 [Pseudenhygromyxa sp. WMMC2535]|uniref:hypothetical protein n=1 Tax=Pseudenhygromyxa sp. WMMC2535 TaxID=2712867 RepID=UPI00159528D9|nr:hypothetical protein [Pseudenhygromyxa sp. WMMC2535]NVB39824.1 hypothetical protein [Pseudenhygromyxa sp. WMMC2535]